MKQLEYVLNNDKEVLAFLKSQYPLYHLSNLFFRDVQYGIQKLFERRGEKLSYPNAEKIAREFVGKLEKEKLLSKIDQQSWVVHYPEYKKPAVTPAAAAKPAAGAAPAKSPAAGGARPPLPPLGSAKPAGGAPSAGKPTLPPLSSAKPAGKPALPPLSSAKPVGGAKQALPPLSSAKPAATAPMQSTASAAPTVGDQSSQHVAKPETQNAPAESPKPEAPKAAASPAVSQPGAKKSLPPLRGNYTPAGKK